MYLTLAQSVFTSGPGGPLSGTNSGSLRDEGPGKPGGPTGPVDSSTVCT